MTSQTEGRIVELREQVEVRYADISRVFPPAARQMLIDASITGGGTEIVRGPDGSIDHVEVSNARVRAIGEATNRLKQMYPHLFKQPSRSTHARR